VTCFKDDLEHGTPLDRQSVQTIISKLLPLLLQRGDFRLVCDLSSARVPLLKLKFEERIEVDLTCDNRSALLNSQLLKAYGDIHPAVRDLVLLVKLWAKEEGVCGASLGNLSSYGLTLMVIYFLQVQLKLPCLPTSAFETLGPGPAAAHWPCPLPMTTLFSQFFNFFAYEFMWGTEVASIRLGRRANAHVQEFRKLPGRNLQRLHIEDPFLLERNLNCVLGERQEKQLRFQLIDGAQLAKLGQVSAGLQLRLSSLRPAAETGYSSTLEAADAINDAYAAASSAASLSWAAQAARAASDEAQAALAVRHMHREHRLRLRLHQLVQ
ncbi:unnamed protein product, partial [Polarella glacialis]